MTAVAESPTVAGQPEPPLPKRLAWSLGSGTVLQGLNSAIIAVALVPIAQHFGDSGQIAWIVSGLYIAAAIGAPTGGKLADVLGARRVYLAGLVIVLIASVAGPFVPTAGWLVADRVLLGLGTSLQFPAAMKIIREQAARRQASPVGAIGVVALCGQGTAALGPTVGGLLVVATGWQGIFWINVPMVILSAVAVMLTVPRDDARRPEGSALHRITSTIRALDPPGMILVVVALVLLMLGLLALEGDGVARGLVLVGASVPVLGLLAWRELRTPSPFVDVRLMVRHRSVGLTCARAVGTFLSFYCIFYGIPQWLEQTRGLDAAGAGLLMLPVFGVGAVGTIVATRIGARWSPRMLLTVGTTAMVIAGALLALLGSASTPIWVLAVICALLGVPNGFNNMGNQLMLHHGVPADAAGSASGVYRTAQYVGAALSAVVVAHVIDPAALHGGIRPLGAVIAGVGGYLLVCTLVARRRGTRTETPA